MACFGEARAEALDRAADHLALGQQRVHDPAGVVDGDELRDPDLPGGALDLDGGGVGAGGEDLLGLEARAAGVRAVARAGRRTPRRRPSRPSRCCGWRTSRARRRSRRCRRARRSRCAGSMPSLSAAICANRVSWPWPVGIEPTLTVTCSPSRVTSAYSNRPPERSTERATPVPVSVLGRANRRGVGGAAQWRVGQLGLGSGAAARSARARGPGSARSRRSRRSSRARSGSGNSRIRLRRRSSTGSSCSWRAAWSSVVSIR